MRGVPGPQPTLTHGTLLAVGPGRAARLRPPYFHLTKAVVFGRESLNQYGRTS